MMVRYVHFIVACARSCACVGGEVTSPYGAIIEMGFLELRKFKGLLSLALSSSYRWRRRKWKVRLGS